MKLLLTHGNSIYKFLNITRAQDGSIYISIDRKVNAANERLTTKIHEATFTPNEPSKSARRISYHTTGRVNYHGLIRDLTSFFEPLVKITEINSVLLVSVPSVASLDPYLDTPNTAVGHSSIAIHGLNRFMFCVTLAPPTADEKLFGSGIKYDYENFTIFIHRVNFDLVPPTSEHFVYAAPPSMFPNQRLGKFEAELAYIQGSGNSEIVIHGPNKQGVYTLYFSQVMRTAPCVTVRLFNQKNRFDLCENKDPHKLKFKIHGKGNLIRDANLRSVIMSIELDAEL